MVFLLKMNKSVQEEKNQTSAECCGTFCKMIVPSSSKAINVMKDNNNDDDDFLKAG